MSTAKRSLALAAVLIGGACAKQDVPPQAAMAEAKRIWNERCSNCHGPQGHGNGPGAKILTVKPRALSDSAWQARVTDEEIATIIVDGGQAVGLSPLMAANPDLRTKPEIVDALVHHIRQLSG